MESFLNNHLGEANQEVAESLTVRLVDSESKTCKVLPNFRKAFKDDTRLKTEFPYRQKVFMLFQEVQGVDICIFSMYVQEYGKDSPEPNRNTVCLSYLDSVNFFQPDRREERQGCKLRTYVYHLVVLAYMELARNRGFEQVSIWVCPPRGKVGECLSVCVYRANTVCFRISLVNVSTRTCRISTFSTAAPTAKSAPTQRP
jgi:hypothetical protein